MKWLKQKNIGNIFILDVKLEREKKKERGIMDVKNKKEGKKKKNLHLFFTNILYMTAAGVFIDGSPSGRPTTARKFCSYCEV